MNKVEKIINSPIKNHTIKKITDNIFNLCMETQEELCLTFLRFQEYYESPRFKDKIFTLKEYIKWYSEENEKEGKGLIFSYPTDWNGFNLPSKVLKPFYDGEFELTRKEKDFLELFEDNKGDFYIIGTHTDNTPDYYESLIRHEIAHGLYYTDVTYKNEVNDILSTIDKNKTDALSQVFSKMGYHKSVHTDETHAYLQSDTLTLEKEGIDIKPYEDFILKLRKVYVNHLKRHNKQIADSTALKWGIR